MDDFHGSGPVGVPSPTGNAQHCPVPPVGHGGQLMLAPMCSDYTCGGLVGDCQSIAPLDPNSWMSAECCPSEAYDLPITQTPVTNLPPLNHLNPAGPIPSHSHHQELGEPAAVCVKAERTYTPDGSRTHHSSPSLPFTYEDSFQDDPTKYRSLRPHSTPATLLWLDENYEMAEGVCIPRNALYLHYVDFCAKNAMQPVNAASFGRIIRQQFPALTTRRLGTRGQSRYHYYGIAIREHSPYYEPTYSKKSGETPDTGGKRQLYNSTSTPTPMIDNGSLKGEHLLNHPPGTAQLGGSPANQRVKLTAVPPEFPTLRALNITSAVDREQVSSFLTMYRTHSQRILDTILAMNLDQVRVHLQHFWFGIPQHVASGLGCPVLVNLVALCDLSLSKTVQGLLLPSLTQPLPESFIRMVDIFTQDYEGWLERALVGFPKALQHTKVEVGKRFISQLRRRLSLNQVSQAVKMLLLNRQVVEQMVQDWRNWKSSFCSPASPKNGRSTTLTDDLAYFQLPLAFPNLAATTTMPPAATTTTTTSTTTSTTQDHSEKGRTLCCQDALIAVLTELESCLETSTSLETFLLWMDSVVEKYTNGANRTSAKRAKGFTLSRGAAHSQREICSGFFRTWRACSQRIFRELTIKGTAHYASFQLLRVLFDDYIHLSLESVMGDCLVREVQDNIANNRPLDVGHINVLEIMSTTQTPLGRVSPRVQLSSHVTTALSVHPPSAAHIEAQKTIQLCAIPPQVPPGTALLEKAKQLRRVGVGGEECPLEVQQTGQPTTQDSPAPVAIFYETTNCYAGVTSVIQQTTNIITTTSTAATAAAGSLYGPTETLEVSGTELGCSASQPGGQCLIITGEPSAASGAHPGSVKWAPTHQTQPGHHPQAHYAAATHHYRQALGTPGTPAAPIPSHHLHHFN